tara:strand:+ start:483 stop:977 length:495 start_codon:yes stop_codon:yes gene_type:complete
MMLVRKYLDHYGIRVGKWYPHWTEAKPDQPITYEACFDTHRVFIPVPVDDYSFYVCMHEIGHLVTGTSNYAYQQEWKAEQWSLKKCRQYGYYTKKLEKEAKAYVLRHLYEDMILRGYDVSKVPQKVMNWMDRDVKRVTHGAVRWANKWSRDLMSLSMQEELIAS